MKAEYKCVACQEVIKKVYFYYDRPHCRSCQYIHISFADTECHCDTDGIVKGHLDY